MENRESISIEVVIFNKPCRIRLPENLTEDQLREIAKQVDEMMQNVSRRGYDPVQTAILVALNLTATIYHSESKLSDLTQQINIALENSDD